MGQRAPGGLRGGCAFGNFSGCAPGTDGVNTDDVGLRPMGDSPYGAQDMGGNVQEWVSDWSGDYRSTPPDPPRTEFDPRGPATAPDDNSGILRGGSYTFGPSSGRAALRTPRRVVPEADSAFADIGFRCCRPLP